MVKRTLGFCAALCALVMVGCGNGGSTSTDAGAPDAPIHCASGSATAGQTLVTGRACASCHGADLGGGVASARLTNPGPNLTPAQLAGWTDDQIATAVLDGIDDEGAALCTSMYRYRNMRMTETEACNVAAYLRTIPAVTRTVANNCN